VQPPPVDMPELIARARQSLPIPTPGLAYGPDRDRVAVNFWTSIWLIGAENPAPITVRDPLGRVTLTARLELVLVTVNPGERDPQTGAQAAAVECSAATARVVNSAEGGCGYTYRWRSLPARTAGSGTWQMQATVRWRFSWQATGAVPAGQPRQGGEDATSPNLPLAAVSVGEWRTAGGFNTGGG